MAVKRVLLLNFVSSLRREFRWIIDCSLWYVMNRPTDDLMLLYVCGLQLLHLVFVSNGEAYLKKKARRIEPAVYIACNICDAMNLW